LQTDLFRDLTTSDQLVDNLIYYHVLTSSILGKSREALYSTCGFVFGFLTWVFVILYVAFVQRAKRSAGIFSLVSRAT